MRWLQDPILDVQHLTMRFGGLVAINDLSFQAGRGDITALIGPNGAGKTTVFNCITGFYKPTEGMVALRKPDGSHLLLERLPGFDINWKAQGRPHLPEHPPVLRHDRAREPAGGPAQPADDRLGLHLPRRARHRRLPQGREGGDREGEVLAREDPPHPTAPTIRPATCPTAISAAWKSPAPCAPTRCCSASTSRRPASTRASRTSSTSCCCRSARTTAPRSC